VAEPDCAGAFGRELTLGAPERRELGLAAEEALRVVHRGGRTLLLERGGRAADCALPWDRDLVLQADVRAFPMADVLRILHDAGKSGYLLFGSGEVEKAVYLNRGEVVFAASNQGVDRLGECLLRSGAIDLDQLCDAEQAFSPPGRFGRVLVERGHLSPRELWNGVKFQVEEIVRSLFAHTEGWVHLWEGEVQPDNVVRLALPTRRLVTEGLQRRDELLRFVASLEEPRARLEAVDRGAARRRSGNEQRVLEGLAEEDRFPDLCRRTGLDPLSAARLVQLLCVSGDLRVRREAVTGAAGGSGEDERVRACVRDHLALLSELSSPLVALEGLEPVSRRLGRIFVETAERHPALLEGLEVGPGGLPDPGALTARALRAAGDRLAAVQAALGELVAYVEFELLNSPHLDEPDRYLDALKELRARVAV